MKISKEAEQEAFLASLHNVLKHYGEKRRFQSVPEAIKWLRASIRKGKNELNGALSRTVFTGTRLFPLLSQAVAFLDQPQKTLDLFGSARKAAVKRGALDSSNSLFYLFRHPKMVWSAFTSSWLGHKMLGKFFPFDPKGFARNLSGLLCVEKREALSIEWLLGPTPTLGNKIAPEMERAIECLQHEERWVYVNLQSLGSKSERPRSLALLDASRRYPEKFCAASLSVDSPLYKGQENILPEEHKKRLLKDLSRAIFLNDTTWYFFSLKASQKEKWWSIAEDSVEKAFLLASDDNMPAFHELVVLGLIRAWQAFHADGVTRLLSTTACKECIDRGGSVNAAFVWALLGDEVGEEERAAKVMAVLWGRPLLAKKRLIEKSRTKGFKALVETLCPKDVRAYLKDVWYHAATAEDLGDSSRLVL